MPGFTVALIQRQMNTGQRITVFIRADRQPRLSVVDQFQPYSVKEKRLPIVIPTTFDRIYSPKKITSPLKVKANPNTHRPMPFIPGIVELKFFIFPHLKLFKFKKSRTNLSVACDNNVFIRC